MKTLEALKRELMKDKEFRKEYKRLGPEFELIALRIEKRIQKEAQQKASAKKLRIKQSAVAKATTRTTKTFRQTSQRRRQAA